MSAREVTPKMVHAASQWLSNLHHMRKVDRLNAIEDAIRAALDATPDQLDMSPEARLSDAESDVDRLHKEKMELWGKLHFPVPREALLEISTRLNKSNMYLLLDTIKQVIDVSRSVLNDAAPPTDTSKDPQ